MGHEQRVRTFYDYAGPAYEALMDDTWHHGDPAAEARGLPPRQAARALEERLVRLAGLRPGDRALDFGSGVGGATLHMAARTGRPSSGCPTTNGSPSAPADWPPSGDWPTGCSSSPSATRTTPPSPPGPT